MRKYLQEQVAEAERMRTRAASEGKELPETAKTEDGMLLSSLPDLPSEPTEPTFAGLDISELQEHADSKVDWIVDRIFSSDQPTLFGARSKCLKTTQLVDLAVSLASGSQWLGAFDIPKKRRVLFITGEANNRAISRRLYKAAAARGLKFCDLAGMIRVEAVHFPKLQAELLTALKRDGQQAVAGIVPMLTVAGERRKYLEGMIHEESTTAKDGGDE